MSTRMDGGNVPDLPDASVTVIYDAVTLLE